MAKISIYAASAAAFARSLTALAAILEKAEADSKARKYDFAVLMQSRLAPDMLTLTGQIHLATAFAKNTVCRLTGQTPPDFSDLEPTYDAAKARIAKTLDIIQSISESDYAGADTREINIKVGQQDQSFTGADYLVGFALPNFYFHVTTAYDILRHNGVQIGKRDFMGQ